MLSSVIGGAMLPHAPQFFTMPETEEIFVPLMATSPIAAPVPGFDFYGNSGSAPTQPVPWAAGTRRDRSFWAAKLLAGPGE
jgi:hypothetical protein